ncbi:ABC transporter substrate-binding protein [Afipia sp. Root123D2]|uniref:ABC transporter substrate-binding protein n=1 Tax=Afipia sp. Root123D2 TaxID=1736436 RepID=UPI0009EAA8FD|nr:ABC transporter substrate-binding protein [Afipia sp. Root123D2]
MDFSYRDRLKLLGGLAAATGLHSSGVLPALDIVGGAFAQDVAKKALRVTIIPEPPILNSAFNTAIMVQQISTKMLDGLLTYDKKFDPMPSLAIEWKVADDGLSIAFKLRPNVKWHDGAPFSSADVKYTFEEVLKKHHPRGRATFANVDSVETPDSLTAIIKLSKPSPYVMAALSASESPILPKHLYEGGDPPTNKLGMAPVGTGPYKFVEWQRGSYISLARNPDYWVKGKPEIESLVVRFIPDSGARAVAFETGELDIGGTDPVALADLERIKSIPHLAVTTEGYAMCGAMYYFEFNMRDPQFKDLRVRQAIAHAINRDFVAKNVWFGYGSAATGPVSQKLVKFYNPDVPKYPFDPKKAEALLDAAGFPRKAGGVRFRITHDPSTYSDQYRRFAEYFKQAMRAIGIDVDIQNADAATFQRRIWTDNVYQTASYGIFNMSDPTIGVQRMYWSKNIRKGVPYSNGSGYSNPEMDKLLEVAQNEIDPVKRREFFNKMQVLAMTDLSIIPIINVDYTTVYNKRVEGLTDDLEGVFGTYANISLA